MPRPTNGLVAILEEGPGDGVAGNVTRSGRWNKKQCGAYQEESDLKKARGRCCRISHHCCGSCNVVAEMKAQKSHVIAAANGYSTGNDGKTANGDRTMNVSAMKSQTRRRDAGYGRGLNWPGIGLSGAYPRIASRACNVPGLLCQRILHILRAVYGPSMGMGASHCCDSARGAHGVRTGTARRIAVRGHRM